MQAAQEVHTGDRQPCRHAAGQRQVRDRYAHGHADQRREHVAADYRPRLGQRATWDAKQQYRRGAHGGDKPDINLA